MLADEGSKLLRQLQLELQINKSKFQVCSAIDG